MTTLNEKKNHEGDNNDNCDNFLGVPKGGGDNFYKAKPHESENINNCYIFLGVPLAGFFSGPGQNAPPPRWRGFLCRVRFLSQMHDAVVGITAESTPPKMAGVPVLF